MTVFFTIIHLLLCAFLILAVLLQAGKGGGLSASVGGGLSSSSVLGGRAATTFLTKATTFVAGAFLVSCLLLAAVYDSGSDVPTSASQRLLEEGAVAPVTAPLPFETGAAVEGKSSEGEAASALPQ